MNPATIQKAIELFDEIKRTIPKKSTVVQIVVAPPSIYMAALHPRAKKTIITVRAQNVFSEKEGAFTGEISISMLKSLEITHVILGHSERRARGETDEEINKKILAVLAQKCTAVLCVGEKKRDAQGDYFTFIESQLKKDLANVPKSALSRLVIAYEPIWAIGTGAHATAEDVQEMKLFLQKTLTGLFERSAIPKVRILYGGSVNKENAHELLEEGGADGFLIGGASLKALEFTEIIRISDAYARR